ncbi:MAG: 4Fe-4S binding protein [Dissulfurispiraceae bacterium]|jgi:MauM/NapG family ferredoxin protein|nr:4Fe-4S binding protein [Dissulfurispiraceae bacterium]
MKNLRRISQAFFLLLFLFMFIQTESKGLDELGYPVKIFLDLDPLISITTLLAAHAVPAAYALSVLLIIITLLLGRVFCGWICPLGTLHNIAGLLNKKQKQLKAWWAFRLKYLILIALLVSSVFTMQVAGLLDPISLLIRSLSLSIYPAFNYTVRSFFDTIYSADIKTLTAVSEWIYSLLKKSLLSFNQPIYLQGFLIGIFFIFILSLNLLEKRFWCRHLCPLGAMLGLLSKFSILKRNISEGCTECGACAPDCHGAASPDIKGSWKDTECYYCLNCDDACPNNAVSFGFRGKKRAASIDLGRRRVVTSALAGIAAVPILRAEPFARSNYHMNKLIRPPGSLEENEFLKRCVKCGECMKVCITNGLQPTLFEAGIEGIWSPLLVPRMGYCEYNCTLCGQVCPTGAIKKLTKQEKAETKIGLAMIDKNRCLPYTHGINCIVCEEVCPTPQKAIWFENAAAVDRKGNKVRLKQPRVDLDLCIGCGICEAKCPVVDQPAIYVTSIGESRSKDNRLLL